MWDELKCQIPGTNVPASGKHLVPFCQLLVLRQNSWFLELQVCLVLFSFWWILSENSLSNHFILLSFILDYNLPPTHLSQLLLITGMAEACLQAVYVDLAHGYRLTVIIQELVGIKAMLRRYPRRHLRGLSSWCFVETHHLYLFLSDLICYLLVSTGRSEPGVPPSHTGCWSWRVISSPCSFNSRPQTPLNG